METTQLNIQNLDKNTKQDFDYLKVKEGLTSVELLKKLIKVFKQQKTKKDEM